MLRGLVTLFIAFQFVNAHAQEWEFGLQGGSSGYMGDLNPETPFAFNDWAAGAFIKYNLNHTWGIRGNFAHANTFAYDGYSSNQQRKNRNLGFFGAINEAALLVDFNFFKWLPQRGRIVYTPYIFAGIGGIQFNPKWYRPPIAGASPQKVNLRPVQTEYHMNDNPHPYAEYAISIPFGAGFKYNLRGLWSIGIELAYRLTLTDYLDDVSGNYPIHPNQITPYLPGDLTLDDWQYLTYRRAASALPGSQRGDGRPYDSFMTVGITLSYTIFKGGCPEWQ
ncbi:DUF6089 family protein [Parapedobacter indicus]|uniref:Outer membrane protein beta-barrel domain-containing protein n=1 Tax=Parapedobacter indicus TaxID=1477437 RepID=A0A1I3CZD0_9SPHI|nr:DUF6089 family protein [Parapedobacter indicus]PPL04454.1 outer membrane protein with beta-barrel domain [Parapedobacter indicus]SFH79591.1 Outer membrane protein beta-barrel domain-containing protein [Parapedobacter indicus]